MKKLKLILVMATLCLFFNQAKAQTIQITGVINDNQGKTLSGATIQILNQKTKTTSKTDGTFSIASQTPTGTLKISYLGYQSKEIQFNSNSLNRFIITVEPNDTELKQVEINAGYYTVKDKERTGSISRVSAETISKQPINNPLQALQGRVPGVEIVQNTGVPGGGFTVKIRGQNSIANGNAPLYIVDGIPVPSTSLSSNTINVMISPMASPLSSINPNDIESIEILKDADATAIYGSRGANGVILITSKKGKNGDEKLDVNFYQGKGKITRKIELLNTQQYIEMRKEAFKNDNITPQASDYDINGTWDQNRYTDLQKELIGGTANMSNAQLAYSGGNVNTTFMLSGTYYKESTVFPGEHDYQKKSAHLNISHNSSNQKFSLQLNTNYNNEDSTLPQVDLTASIMLPPNIPVLRNQDGGINWENGTFPSNPLIYLYKNYTAKTNTITSNISLDYKFLTGLELTTRAGYTRMQRNELQTSPLSILNPYAGPYTADNRSAYFSDAYNQTINLEPQLNWKTRLGQGKLNFMLGSTIQQNQLHKQTLQGKGAINDGLLANIGASPSITTREVLNATYRYLSAYGRINYSLKEKYYLNITARRDGSSRFGADNLYANFGAVGAAWIFSNEHFISDHLNFLSFGKLRASYGTSGNDQIGDYNFLELWGTTTYAYQGAAGLYPSRISNPSYAWETNRKFETAMELGFLQDKIQLTTAYFRNRSSNQLVRSSLPPSTGFTFIQANLPATVQNSGLEIEIMANQIGDKTFNWSSSVNFTLPKSKLIAFPNLEKSSSYAQIYSVGQALNILKTLKMTGVDPATGLYTFFDFNGDGAISSPADRQVISVLGQKFSGGFQNVFNYKRWQLDFLIQFVKQTGTIYANNVGIAPGGMSNQPTVVLARWQKPNDITNIQKYTINEGSTSYGQAQAWGDLTIGDASYIRLKNLALAYQLPQQLIGKFGAKITKVYLQSQNLITISKFLGLDPESQNFLSLPPLSVISLGLQVSF